MKENSSEKTSAGKMASGYLKQFGKAAATVLDLVVMFVIAEYLARITSDSVYFKIVDVRLLFVILMGVMHGLMIGTVAAVLECVMLVIRYSAIGISGLLLFYNVENWIPFVYYLTAGIICGYTHQKHVQQMKSVSTENDLIRKILLYEMAVVFTLFMIRRTQILSNACNQFTAFLYLCGLEILPAGLLVVSALVF